MTDPIKDLGGRPSKYTDELAAQICAEMSEGRSLKSICEDEGMPHIATIFRWLGDSKHEAFCDNYARAMEMRAQAMFEDMQEIADDAAADYVETKKGLVVVKEIVQRSKLRIETRQWMLMRMAPKKYGDKLQLEGKVDNTHQWREDDETILDRLARQRVADKKVRKPKPQEDDDHA